MKKLFLGIIGTVLAVGIVGVIYLSTHLTTLVENMGQKVLGAPVSVTALKLQPFSGVVEMSGVTIGNPEGYTSEQAFNLSSVRAKVDLGTLRNDVILINEIIITKPELTFEGAFSNNNISTLAQNAQNYLAQTTATEPEATPTEQPEAKAQKRIAIELFALEDATLNVVANTPAGQQSLSQQLPTLRLTNIGTKEEGITPQQAIHSVMTSITQSADRVALKALDDIKGVLQNGVDTIKGRVKTLTDDVKGLLKF